MICSLPVHYRRSKNLISMQLCFVAQDLCAVEKHACEQICVNTPGSYVCQCYEGYELHANGKNCIGEYEFSNSHFSLHTNQREIQCKLVPSLVTDNGGKLSSPVSVVDKEEHKLVCTYTFTDNEWCLGKIIPTNFTQKVTLLF